MSWLKKHAGSARVLAVVAIGGLAMTGCATNGYVDEQIAAVNSRLDATDARVTTATQKADAAQSTANSANQAASAANSAAQSAATDARTSNQRLDQLGGRVDALEKPPTRKPRG